MNRSNFLFLFSALLLSCSPDQSQSDPNVYAKVGQVILTEEMVISKIPPGVFSSEDSLRMKEIIQSDWIREQLLYRHASDLNIHQLSSYRNELKRIERELTLVNLTDEILKKNSVLFEVSKEEASEFIQRNRDPLTLDEAYVKIRPFTSASRRDAETVRNALLKGEDWTLLVSQYSMLTDEQLEIQLLYIPISSAFIEVPSLNRLIPNLGINEVSEIVEYNGGFHFVQLLEVKPIGETADLDWTLSQVQYWLKEEKKRKYLNSYIRNLYLQSESRNELFIRDLNDL